MEKATKHVHFLVAYAENLFPEWRLSDSRSPYFENDRSMSHLPRVQFLRELKSRALDFAEGRELGKFFFLKTFLCFSNLQKLFLVAISRSYQLVEYMITYVAWLNVRKDVMKYVVCNYQFAQLETTVN